MPRIIYLHENHGRNLLRSKSLIVAKVFDLHGRVSALVNNLEGPGFNILLHNRVLVASANETPIIVRHAIVKSMGE